MSTPSSILHPDFPSTTPAFSVQPRAALRHVWRRISAPASDRDCLHLRGWWPRLGRGPAFAQLDGFRYCIEACLEPALRTLLSRTASAAAKPRVAHRIPLGLLLLSRQQVTAEQLSAALEAQRLAGRGRIGEWLEAMGFVSETQVTAALARQWSCPILRPGAPVPAKRIPPIPHSLLEAFLFWPVSFVEATRTLHVACAEGPDYGLLYEMGRMLDCRTEPCLAPRSLVRRQLEDLASAHRESEAVFDGRSDIAETARIIRSYCARTGAAEIRVGQCHPHLWIRLLRLQQPPVDLWMRSPRPHSAPADRA